MTFSFFFFFSPHRRRNRKQFTSAQSSQFLETKHTCCRKTVDYFPLFFLFLKWSRVHLENRTHHFISHRGSLAGRFVPGSVPFFFITSPYFTFCLGHLDTKQTKQRLQPLWLQKMFISKWCFSNRSKWHVVISAQLTGAMSFICRFCLGLLVYVTYHRENRRLCCPLWAIH